MSGPARYRAADAQHLLARVSDAAAAPASIHYVNSGSEMVRVAGTGSCALCRHLTKDPDGKAACRRSRETVAALAVGRTAPVPFVCHVGFACVSVSVSTPGQDGFVLTVGPGIPSAAPQGMAERVELGLAALDWPADSDVPGLEDVAVVATTALAGAAAWAGELFRALPNTVEDGPAETGSKPRRSRERLPAPAFEPYQATSIAAALAAGDRSQVRALVKGALEEGRAGAGANLMATRGRAAAIASATLEAAAQAGLDTSAAWAAFDAFAVAVRQCPSTAPLARAILDLLRPIGQPVARQAGSDQSLAAINRILLPKLAERVTLDEIAQALGQHPSAISHRLRRKFNMSFTEYIGRLRVDEAKRLLRTTQLTVTESARRVGVNDAANFTRLFRKYENMTPVEYRKRHGRSG